MAMSDVHTTTPHLDDDGNCLCDCPGCVDDWRPMTHGGARRHCVCPDCARGDCPSWRFDKELHDLVTEGRP
jgi:hypothetical protein